jgi:hypothetical protein
METPKSCRIRREWARRQEPPRHDEESAQQRDRARRRLLWENGRKYRQKDKAAAGKELQGIETGE